MEEMKIILDDCSKIVVNGIEITSVDDWNKVVNSLGDLQEQLQQYKQQIDELKKWLEERLRERYYKLGICQVQQRTQYQGATAKEIEIIVQDIERYEEVLSKLKERDEK